MLKSLSIRNVVLIDKLDLDLQDGFTVLSGETGAGKSILLDALGLILGNRADASLIRHGCDRLSVSADFAVKNTNDQLERICTEHGLEYSDEVNIRRVLGTDGRNKIFFNDQPITQKLLKDIGNCLVEVHGQFDNQGLLNAATHIAVLDDYGAYTAAVQEMQEAYRCYKKTQNDLLELQRELADIKEEEDNLRHWLAEFEQLNPQQGETQELEKQRRQMMNAEKILENLGAAQHYLNAQSLSVRDALRQSQAAVARVNAALDDRYAGIYELLETALVNAEEADEEIAAALREINWNQNDIDRIEGRLFALKDLARKHKVTADELPQVWQGLAAKLQNFTQSVGNEETLRELCRQYYDDYVHKAEIVHKKRTEAAARLDENMRRDLPDLKMEKVRFQTEVRLKEESAWNESGQDEVSFMVATNPGATLGPLNKIASGGELARLMLALKVNLGQNARIDTMIFDEVDSGIGGAAAQAVGDRLAELGKSMQILVVTHSPQVAARSDNHFKVEKISDANQTYTMVKQLNAEEKREEVARMLAGEVISNEARAAAEVLIGA